MPCEPASLACLACVGLYTDCIRIPAPGRPRAAVITGFQHPQDSRDSPALSGVPVGQLAGSLAGHGHAHGHGDADFAAFRQQEAFSAGITSQ